MNEELNGIKPVVLLLGEIVLAHKEWDALRAIAQLRVCHAYLGHLRARIARALDSLPQS